MPLDNGFDHSAESWKREMTRTGGWKCHSLIEFVARGIAEVWMRPCNYCLGCIAKAKKTRTGQAAAEAFNAVEVVVLTGTYGKDPVTGLDWPGAAEFISADQASEIERLRKTLWRRTMEGFKDANGDRVYSSRRKLTEMDRARIDFHTPKFYKDGMGEKGKKTGRCHWHLCLYFDRPSGIDPSPPNKNKRKPGRLQYEKRPDLWRWGGCTVDVIGYRVDKMFSPAKGVFDVRVPDADMRRKIKAIAYVTKYLDKARGVTLRDRRIGIQPDVKMVRSNSRPMGLKFILDEARRCAQLGLPYNGTFSVPGLEYKRKPKKGDPLWGKDAAGQLVALRSENIPTVNVVSGRAAEYALLVYKEECDRLRPGQLYSRTDFMKYRDPDFSEEDYQQTKLLDFSWPERRVAEPVVLPPYRDKAREGFLPVRSGRNVIGMIQVWDTGAARYAPADPARRRRWCNGPDLADAIPDLSVAERLLVEAQLAAKRGPGWLSKADRVAVENALLAARDAGIAAFAKPADKVTAAHLPGMEPDTALRRKMRINGEGHRARARRILRGLDDRNMKARAA